MPIKQLYRSKQNRIVAGVSGGIAEYLGIDPIIIRLIFILLTLGHGAGLLIYLVLWVALQEDPTQTKSSPQINVEERVKAAAEQVASEFKRHRGGNDKTLGVILLILGLLFLSPMLLPSILTFALLLPVLFILIGIWLMIEARRKDN